jgi:hypothetical protein
MALALLNNCQLHTLQILCIRKQFKFKLRKNLLSQPILLQSLGLAPSSLWQNLPQGCLFFHVESTSSPKPSCRLSRLAHQKGPPSTAFLTLRVPHGSRHVTLSYQSQGRESLSRPSLSLRPSDRKLLRARSLKALSALDRTLALRSRRRAVPPELISWVRKMTELRSSWYRKTSIIILPRWQKTKHWPRGYLALNLKKLLMIASSKAREGLPLKICFSRTRRW